MSKQAFQKFINKEPKGAKKKEAIRQEKRKQKAQARAAGEEFRRKKFESNFENKSGEINPSPFKKSSYSSDKRRKVSSQPSQQNRRNSDINNSKQGASNNNSHEIVINAKPATEAMPLNKFIAHAGVSGRREAAELVKNGLVEVNGNKILEPGFKVKFDDKVFVKGKQIFAQKNLVYILLNKPKDTITTTNDPQGRRTVFDLIKPATNERVFTVGRLDRNTTGVLLLTNDGDLAQKLTHPSYEVKKIYEVTLDKPLKKSDFEAILNGIALEDGFIAADALAYADAKNKSIVGIEIHSGRNRIVRRIFEHLGYEVKSLDRVMFANLTKKNVDRGKWRFLSEKEIRLLKYMNQSFVRAKSEQHQKSRS